MEHRSIIDDLKLIKERVYSFINPVTPEMLSCFISGMVRGYLLKNDDVSFPDYRHTKNVTISSRGWEIRSTSPSMEMREKMFSDDEIITELLDIEIETWQMIENNKET